MTTLPVLDRMERGLYEALSTLGVPVSWAYGEPDWEYEAPDAWVGLRVVGGPRFPRRQHVRATTQQRVSSLDITFPNIGPLDTRLVLYVNGREFYYDAPANQVGTDAAAAFGALLQADPYLGLSVSIGPGAVVTLAPASSEIIEVAVAGGLVVVPTYADEYLSVSRTTGEIDVEVAAFSKSRTARDGALALAHRCVDVLGTPQGTEILRHYGVGVWTIGAVADISALGYAHFETRATFTVTIHANTFHHEPVDVIEQVTTT